MSSLNKRKTVVGNAELTLALNAAEGRLHLALGRMQNGGSDIFFAQEWQAQAQGVELLAPVLEQALAALKLEPRHIGRIAVVNGPGGFTGLRLTIVTAAALARGTGALQAPMPYMPLLAAQAHNFCITSTPPELIWIITHARRGLVYMQSFYYGPALQPSSELLVLAAEDAAALLASESSSGLVLGSGLGSNQDIFVPLFKNSRTLTALPDSFAQVSAPFLVNYALSLPDNAYSGQDLTPLYVRPSDAEENLPHIAEKLGLDAEDSRERLDSLLNGPVQAEE